MESQKQKPDADVENINEDARQLVTEVRLLVLPNPANDLRLRRNGPEF